MSGLISQRRIWRGKSATVASPLSHSTGWAALDAVLPTQGWPDAALTEVMLPADGIGELQLLWPALARLSQPKGSVIALIAPPYHPYPPAWHAAGVRLGALQVINTKTAREALWAAEQCLRSGACSAVLCWPQQADDRALRRLQVAAETGQGLGFAFRPMKAALNPSPAALRIALDARPRQLRVLKCRGGMPPARPIPFPSPDHSEGDEGLRGGLRTFGTNAVLPRPLERSGTPASKPLEQSRPPAAFGMTAPRIAMLAPSGHMRNVPDPLDTEA